MRCVTFSLRFLLFALLLCAGPVSATQISFSEFPTNTAISTQYADKGVVVVSSAFITTDGSNPTSPVLSGIPQFTGPITVKFVVPNHPTAYTTATKVSFDAGYFNNTNSTKVTWFDTQGNTLGSTMNTSLKIQRFTIPGTIAGFTIGTVGEELAGFAIDNLAFTITKLISVKWQTLHSPLDNNPNVGAGIRIYPEKLSPTDTAERRTVTVHALTNGGAGTLVYFKSFDVDDPASDVDPIDPNGPPGNDNRGVNPTGVLSSAMALTDASGAAETTLRVSTQPGDNFMVAASLSPSYLTGITERSDILKDASAMPLPTDSGVVTPLLTVWRRVHIEVDSMDKVHDNFITGPIESTVYIEPANLTYLFLNQAPEAKRFEHGAIYVNGDAGHPVIQYFMKVVVVPGKITTGVTNTYRMVDDDDLFDQFGGLPKGDDGLFPPKPDTSLLQNSDNAAQNVFAPAYVKPTYDIGHSDSDVPFTLNSVDAGLVGNYKYDNSATAMDNNFWTVYLLGAYQFETGEDGDPNSESVTFGIVDDIKGLGANVFTETLSAHELTGHHLNGRPAVSKAATAAHEIGHLFNGDHADLGLMSQSGLRTTTQFSNISIAKIRSLDHP